MQISMKYIFVHACSVLAPIEQMVGEAAAAGSVLKVISCCSPLKGSLKCSCNLVKSSDILFG